MMAIGKHAMPANKSHDILTTPDSFNPSSMITHTQKHNKNESQDLIKNILHMYNELTTICMLSIYMNGARKP